MQTYIANKQNQKLLRVYLLKSSYDLTKSLDKQISTNLATSCIIIRKTRIKNQTEFGYKQSLKTGFIKKIHFVYLNTLNDLITFLWAHLNFDKVMTAGIFIDSIEQYFGQRFTFQQNGRSIAVCINLMIQLSEKYVSITKKQKIKIAFSFCYNSYVFQRADYMNYMANSNIICWEIAAKEIFKNGHQFQNQWTKAFLEQYSSTKLKQQQVVDE